VMTREVFRAGSGNTCQKDLLLMATGMADKFDIVIGGGGFIGLALARALAMAAPGRLRMAVVDQLDLKTRSFSPDGRAMTISAASRRMLQAIGVWDEVGPQAQPLAAIAITDTPLHAPFRPVLLQFDTAVEGDQPAAHVVENAVLMRALLAKVMETDVTLLAPHQVHGVKAGPDGVCLDLGGAAVGARLLVIADGRRSQLRRMAGMQAVQWDFPQMGLVTTVAHEKPHGGRAVQHFLPAGPFAILPMTGDRSSLVWTETPAEAARLAALPEHALSEAVTLRFGRQLGVLRLLAPVQTFALSLSMAREFVRPNIALIGDAAHGLHWLAGQGLNHGFRDVAALSEVIVEAQRLGMDFAGLASLRRYERWRRFDAASSTFVMEALNRLFANDIGPLRVLRGIGLGVVDRMTPLKRLFVEEAAGTTGDIPRLMRGALP
jgi:2-octaprenyl-6-methoxyphenol hydroxylase